MQAGALTTGKKRIKCPFHDDKNPSAEIKQADSGFWYFYCYACDISDDVWSLKARVTGMSIGEVLKTANPTRTETPFVAKVSFRSFTDLLDHLRKNNPRIVIEEENPYTDPETKQADFYTIRYRKEPTDKKRFMQASLKDGQWQYSAPIGKLPLFNRQAIQLRQNILIVEGEKCVREFTKIGMKDFAATTSPGGANAPDKADWSVLNGKTVYLWRDNDEPGKKYEETVLKILETMDCKIYRVRVEELGLDLGGDIADYLNEDSMTNADKVAAVQNVLHDAEGINTANSLDDRLQKMIAGEFRSIAFMSKPHLSHLARAVMPGSLVTLVGDPGAGKSFMLLEDFWRWHMAGEKVRILMLEEDHGFHMNRALAQMSGHGDLLDPDFVFANPDFTKITADDYRALTESFAPCLTAVGSKQMTLNQVVEWVRLQATSGIRIIAVDPITAAEPTEKPWIADQKFIFQVKPILEETGATLFLSTHPRVGQAGKPSLSGVSGGLAYTRFAQTVLWVTNFDEPQESEIWKSGYKQTVEHKQALLIKKARNGKGHGSQIAMNLNTQNLCFDEIGVVCA